jgi:hypothetical protein
MRYAAQFRRQRTSRQIFASRFMFFEGEGFRQFEVILSSRMNQTENRKIEGLTPISGLQGQVSG